MISRNVRKVREGASKSACARPRKPPARSIALRRLPDVGAHRRERQAVRRARLVRHPSGATAWRTRKPPEAEHENACFTGCTKRVVSNSSAFPNSLFRVARRAGDFVWPEGAFRVRRCGVARQGSRKVQRRRRGEASSREAMRLPCGRHKATRRPPAFVVARKRPAAIPLFPVSS